jgi:GTP-binding protein
MNERIGCIQAGRTLVAVPQVVIVGRPNVGKSSLFNWLAGRRIAIVDPTPGVTRDRLTAPIQAGDRYFELVDTGGIGVADADNLTGEIERQIQLALDQASLVLFLTDVRTGRLPLDEEVARRLRALPCPVVLVANKCDTAALEPQAVDFHRLGLGEPLCVSARENRGKQELLERIAQVVPVAPEAPAEAQGAADVSLKLAIVGRRNTGKSTFINSLARAERMIVSEVAGTTRDSVDVRFERDSKTIIAIDTAGVRKKGSIRTDVDFYSLTRAERSIRRADVVLLFHDAPASISQVDKQLAGYVLDHYKPAIFVVNKWDLLAGQLPTGEFADYLRQVFPNLDFVPIAFITAKNGKNVQSVLNLAQSLHKQAGARVSTGDLNRVLRQALTLQAPPARQNRTPKIYYATQVATHPPTIVLFTNGPQLFDNTYQRYLLKAFRDHLPFREIPIKMYLRNKRRDERIPDLEHGTASPSAKSVSRRSHRSRKHKEPELWRD